MSVRATAAVLVLVALLVLLPASVALAHGAEEEDLTAKQLVEQAIAVLQEQPGMSEMIDDKINDALTDDETDGVDLDLVDQAATAFNEGRTDETTMLLARSIGEDPERVLNAVAGGGLRAPDGAAGVALLVVALALIAAGVLVARTVR